MSSKYQEALNLGYTPEEINAFLSKKNPQYQQALDAGYSPEEISNYLEKKNAPGNLQNFGQEALRHTARTTSNLATRAVGLPGDIFSLLNEYIASPIAEKISGQAGVPYEETLLGKALPTTETHRKGLEEKTGNLLKPENKVEHFVDNVIEDAALLLNPSQIIKKGAKPITQASKKLAISIGANLAGEGIERSTDSKTAGGVAKLGSMFLLSMVSPGRTVKELNKLYTAAEASLPENAKVSAKNLQNSLDKFKHNITKDRPYENLSSAERYVVNAADKVGNLIKDGEINIAQAWAQKKSLNEELASLYKEIPIHKDQKKVKNLAKQVTGFLNSTIKEYGAKNPEFYKNFRNADEAFGTLARSKWMSNWAKNNITHNPVTVGLAHLFAPIGTAAAGAGGVGIINEGAKLIFKISKSPTLRKIYGSALKAAIKEDAVAFNKYVKELDKSLEKEED